MPKLRFATESNGSTKFYPISITPGIIDTTRNQRLSVTLANLEDKTGIVSTTVANLPATLSVGKYYNITNTVSSMTLNLPAISAADSSTLQVIAVYFTTGSSTPTVNITSANSATISYFSGYEIKASTTYELNILWNGTKWIVAHATIG